MVITENKDYVVDHRRSGLARQTLNISGRWYRCENFAINRRAICDVTNEKRWRLSRFQFTGNHAGSKNRQKYQTRISF